MTRLKICSYLCLFILAMEIPARAESTPQIQYRTVNAAQLEELKQQYPGQIFLVSANSEADLPTSEATPAPMPSPEPAPEMAPQPDRASPSHSTNSGIDWTSGFANGLGSRNGDTFLVVLVALGVIFVIGAFVSGGAALYNLLKPEPKIDGAGKNSKQLFFELGLHESVFGFQSASSRAQWLGLLSGLQFSMESAQQGRGISVGVVGEVGYITYTVKSSSLPQQFDVNTGYWLLGPSIDFFTRYQRSTSPYFFLQTLAGTATTSDVGLISSVRLGFSIPFKGILRLAPEIGANFVRIKADQGLLTVPNEFSMEAGLSLKYQF